MLISNYWGREHKKVNWNIDICEYDALPVTQIKMKNDHVMIHCFTFHMSRVLKHNWKIYLMCRPCCLATICTDQEELCKFRQVNGKGHRKLVISQPTLDIQHQQRDIIAGYVI